MTKSAARKKKERIKKQQVELLPFLQIVDSDGSDHTTNDPQSTSNLKTCGAVVISGKSESRRGAGGLGS